MAAPQPADLIGVPALIAVATKRNADWAATPLRERLEVVRWFRQQLTQLPADAETLVAQLLPLCDACRFLEREAEKILSAAPGFPADGRPLWLRDVEIQTYRSSTGLCSSLRRRTIRISCRACDAPGAGRRQHRDPQAGNGGTGRRPRRCGGAVAGRFSGNRRRVPAFAGVDKVILTWKAATGEAVLAQLAPISRLPQWNFPAMTRFLSGPMPIWLWSSRPSSLGGNSIAARRALRRGDFAARGLQLPWPVTHYDSDEEALALAESEYALGATVFGREPGASEMAKRIRAGVVVVNDMIVPTADPRLAFGDMAGVGLG